ncbi:MAG: DNA-binding protein [Pseudobdellovibrionaceae bacterium]
MDKTKILKKLKKQPKKSMVINGVKLVPHNPSLIFKNHKKIKTALSEALIDGDKEAFVDILSGYVRSHNILEVCRRTGLSRTVVYEAISEDGNPSLDTLCKIMISFKDAA